MNFGPIARIIIRYGVGAVFGLKFSELMAGDADVVALVATGLALVTERAYVIAKRKGWAT